MTAPFPTAFATPRESPGFLLWQVSNAWQRLQREALADLHLTHVQFVLLAGVAWLHEREAPLTQARLAAHARTDVMMTSQVLRTLEAKKLIRRTRDPTDRRAKVLAPTKAGMELARRGMERVERTDAEFFAALGSETDEFAALLRRLAEHVNP